MFLRMTERANVASEGKDIAECVVRAKVSTFHKLSSQVCLRSNAFPTRVS